MKPAPFDFLRAETVDEVLDGLHQAGAQARVIAGGQSLVPMLSMRLARPSLLVDVTRIAALDTISESKGMITVGAAVRQARLQRWDGLAARLPLLAQALPWIGHVQTRARGTVCGSLAHADPSAELPLCLVALGGSVQLRSKSGSRSLSADRFFVGMMATAIGEDEMIESASFPVAASGAGYAFREVGRRHGDFAIVACAAIADVQGIRLAVGGVADRPMRFDLPPPSDPAFDDELNEVAWALDARDDFHATARYRRELVRRLGREAIEEAIQCRN